MEGKSPIRLFNIIKKMLYYIEINLCFLAAVSPFILYFLYAGEDLSVYILLFTGIITAPALATVFSVINRAVKDFEVSAVKDFLYFYRLNFLQGIFAGAIICGMLIICFMDINYFMSVKNTALAAVFIVLAVFTLSAGVFAIPIISRINAKTADVFKTAIKLAVKKFFIVLTVLSVAVIGIIGAVFFKIALPAFLAGPVILCYITFMLEKNILDEVQEELSQKYETPAET